MNNILLECNNLTKNYKDTLALKNVNLSIKSGKIVGLLGPNGSGKTTFIKIANDLLTQTGGNILIDGNKPGVESKAIISYLPDKNYLDNNQSIESILTLFQDFYSDFSRDKAIKMLSQLNINPKMRIKTLSKGNKEKVQLVLVMSRNAKLYLLDEPIAGVDPAARDYILDTILKNYNSESTIIISTHLISDIEKILDEVIFLKDGQILLHETTDAIRERTGKSIDEYFREVFRC